MHKTLFLLIITLSISLIEPAFAQNQSEKKAEKEQLVLISTVYGDIKVKLYNETPLHRDNFIKLVKEKYYDSLLFHRVINAFMIQGGDPNSKNAKPGEMLGNGGPNYTIPAEFRDTLIHKKGALCAARQGDEVNPLKASSGSQFYIVQGRVTPLQQFEMMEMQTNQQMIFSELMGKPEWLSFRNSFIRCQQQRNNDSIQILSKIIEPEIAKELQKAKRFSYNEQQKKYYSTIGGTPHLDHNYTVFGEVIEGLDIIDKIAAVPVDASSRPKEDLRMTVKLIENK